MPSTSDTEPYTSSDSEEEVPTVLSPKANGSERAPSAKMSASKSTPQSKGAIPPVPLLSNTNLTVRPSASKPASIADAVLNISTDSDDSTTSEEEDSEEDATFLPKRVWMSVTNGSSGESPKPTTRGGGSMGTRGRGRGRGGTPGGSGNVSRGQGAKMEKGQQTLGNFFQKPLTPSKGPEQQPVAAVENKIEDSSVNQEDSMKKGNVEQDVNQDVNMEDAAAAVAET